MAKLDVINLKGEKVKDITLAKEVFEVKINEDAISKAVRLELASNRMGTHKAKTRSEVRGGGKKPWRQKGTGRARHGSTRSPIWVGGGVIFAKTPRNYTFKMNRKERAHAFKSALSNKLAKEELIVIDNLNVETNKTKDMVNTLKTLKLDNKKVLFVANEFSENFFLATRNLPTVLVTLPNEVSTLDLVHFDNVIFEEDAIKNIEEALK